VPVVGMEWLEGVIRTGKVGGGWEVFDWVRRWK
jgi:hypothetical protein